MRIPEFLPEGGTIGYIAPAFGCNIEPYRTCFDAAREKFKSMGYQEVLGPNCYKGDGLGISTKPEDCGKELNDMYQAESSDILMTCGGGELMCEVVPYIDFEAVKEAKPKWVSGYSDITNFVFLSATLADTAALYMPCAPTFGMTDWHESLTDAFDLVTGKKKTFTSYDLWEKESLKDEEHPLVPYNLTETNAMHAYVDGKFYRPIKKNNATNEDGKYEIKSGEVADDIGVGSLPEINIHGRLIGGCLDILTNLAGTEFDKVDEFAERYKEDGIIWFMEACDLHPLDMRRAYWHLKNSGWFKYVKGFMIGRPLASMGVDMFGVNQYNACIDILKDFNVPILMDLDIGHIAPMIPLVEGAVADVTFKDCKLTVTYDV